MLKCKLCGNNTDNTSGICFECSGSQHICQCDEVDLARSMKPEEDWEARIKANGKNWINEDKMIPFIQALLQKQEEHFEKQKEHMNKVMLEESKKQQQELIKKIHNILVGFDVENLPAIELFKKFQELAENLEEAI